MSRTNLEKFTKVRIESTLSAKNVFKLTRIIGIYELARDEKGSFSKSNDQVVSSYFHLDNVDY